MVQEKALTTFAMHLSIGSVTIAIAASLYVWHLVQTNGRYRPHDPAAVKPLIETAARFSAEHIRVLELEK